MGGIGNVSGGDKVKGRGRTKKGEEEVVRKDGMEREKRKGDRGGEGEGK